MLLLILGLLIFLGVHSLSVFAPDWRGRQLARLGEGPWKGLIGVASLIGFALIVVGFGQARQDPVVLYAPPEFLRHLNSLFTLLAFLLVVAAYVPGNHIKARLGHPMLVGVKSWAVGHLLAAGMLHDMVLFGSFLAWAVLDFVAARRRDRLAGTLYPAGTLRGDIIVFVVALIAWGVFAFWLHLALIGVDPMA